MEDPAYLLKIDEELRIKDDIKDQIFKITKDICKALEREEHLINREIQQLVENKISRE